MVTVTRMVVTVYCIISVMFTEVQQCVYSTVTQYKAMLILSKTLLMRATTQTAGEAVCV
jgi:hypothetical protein